MSTAGPEPVLLVSRQPGLRAALGGGPRSAARTLLERDSNRAMEIAGSRPLAAAAVDLSFTDGKMDGLELALNLRDTVPGLPVWVIPNRQGRPPKAIRISARGPARSRHRPAGFDRIVRRVQSASIRTASKGGTR